MRTNIVRATEWTHEGAPAKRINAEQQLRRSLMACMLWEDTFYESGVDIADRIKGLVPKVKPELVSAMAIEARNKMKLRHAPLLVTRELARLPAGRPFVRATLNGVIQRADEMAEFLSIYWKDGKEPIAKQVRLGLGDAFNRFNEYQFAKYNRDGTVKLRDVLFLSHANPKDEAQAAIFKKIVDNTLSVPDTWEVELSTKQGEDKKGSWTRLLKENKLGALALLRNLRNMQEAGVEESLIRQGLRDLKPARVLPFRFISAANHAPQFEPELEEAMYKCMVEKPTLKGTTVLLVDVSGSMESTVSGKSKISRLDAACGLAMLLRETCENVKVITFSNDVKLVPPRRGFALRDSINKSQYHSGTYLGKAVRSLVGVEHDRLIVITDEQSHDSVSDPVAKKAYMVNVASYKNGVGYGRWTHIDGWSEAIVDYIAAYENE